MVSDSASHNGGRSKEPIPLSFHEVLLKHLPYYLAIGMTPEQFWDGDVENIVAYREAFKIKQEVLNQQMWLQGMYFYSALCSAAPILRTNLSNETVYADKYMDSPFPLTKEEREKQEKQRAEKEYKDNMEKMNSWMLSINLKKEAKKDGTRAD